MSVTVMSWVLLNSSATLGDRLVLLVLADKAEEDGTNARPSVPTIARQACLSERQVQRCLRNLERDERIHKTGTYRYPGQRRGVNVYQVMMDNMSPFDPPKGDIHDTQTVTPTSPNPSLEPVLEVPAAAPRERPRNELWDALEHVFGPATTRSAQQVRGKVVAGLAVAGATPAEIMRRARAWPQHFDGATMTDLAFEKHYDTLGRKPLRRR